MKQERLTEQEKTTKIFKAHKQEESATVAFLEGKMSLEEFRLSLEKTHPLTKINLRKLASQ